MTDQGIQLYCEHMMSERFGQESFWVTGFNVKRTIDDVASLSTTYLVWKHVDDGVYYEDYYRAECLVHDDAAIPPLVTVTDPATDETVTLEVRE